MYNGYNIIYYTRNLECTHYTLSCQLGQGFRMGRYLMHNSVWLVQKKYLILSRYFNWFMFVSFLSSTNRYLLITSKVITAYSFKLSLNDSPLCTFLINPRIATFLIFSSTAINGINYQFNATIFNSNNIPFNIQPIFSTQQPNIILLPYLSWTIQASLFKLY